MDEHTPDYLTITDITTRLRMSRRSLERLRAAGDFPAPLNFTRRPVWPAAEVYRWAERQAAHTPA